MYLPTTNFRVLLTYQLSTYRLGDAYYLLLIYLPTTNRLTGYYTYQLGTYRLGDALLRARHLGGVARDEVVDDLVLGEARHGRQHAEAVAPG